MRITLQDRINQMRYHLIAMSRDLESMEAELQASNALTITEQVHAPTAAVPSAPRQNTKPAVIKKRDRKAAGRPYKMPPQLLSAQPNQLDDSDGESSDRSIVLTPSQRIQATRPAKKPKSSAFSNMHSDSIPEVTIDLLKSQPAETKDDIYEIEAILDMRKVKVLGNCKSPYLPPIYLLW